MNPKPVSRLRTFGICLALAFALGACAQNQLSVPSAPPAGAPAVVKADPVTDITTLTLADLNAAAADATAHNDVVAAQCYTGLIPVVQAVQGVLPQSGATPIGVVTAFQTARDVKAALAATSGTLARLRAQINLACAPLLIDTQVGIADPLSLFSGIPK